MLLMSPSLSDVEELQSTVSVASSSPTNESMSKKTSGLKELNYLGLSDCSSVGSSTVPSRCEVDKNTISLKATELRLGLPGSESPNRETLDEKQLFRLLPSKDGICKLSQNSVVSGNKRVFSDVMDEFSEVKGSAHAEKNWMLPGSGSKKEMPKNTQNKQSGATNNNISPPAAKAQVVGWPPVRSFRKNTMATTSKNDEVDGKPGSVSCALFVKVSMDGAPYLRKVDLRNYTSYQELSSALEKMFSCFTLGQCGSYGAPGREMLCETKLKDVSNGSEYVVTYEDKDGDWMLVGDVPWEMFIDACKRLKIVKGSDAIGLGMSF